MTINLGRKQWGSVSADADYTLNYRGLALAVCPYGAAVHFCLYIVSNSQISVQ